MNRERRNLMADLLETSIDEGAIEGWAHDPVLAKWAERMRKCGDGAFFTTDPETGRKIITNFRGCKVRVCPICSWRASIRNACRYTARIESYFGVNPTSRLRFVTLTDCPVLVTQLQQQCQRLHEAFASFYKALDRAFVGYLRCTDIDTCARDPDGSVIGDYWFDAPMFVRPHIHAIMLQRPKNGRTHVTDGEIKGRWTEAMGSSVSLNTHIKAVDTPFGAAKYASKGVAWANAAGDYNYAAAMALALHGIRCISAGGALRREP